MSYSSVWISVPGTTARVMIGLMVACCTLGSMCRITASPRWIRPRTGGFSFSSVPRPGAPASLRHRPGRPFLLLQPVGPYARPQSGHNIDLIDLSGAFQLHGGCPCDQTL